MYLTLHTPGYSEDSRINNARGEIQSEKSESEARNIWICDIYSESRNNSTWEHAHTHTHTHTHTQNLQNAVCRS